MNAHQERNAIQRRSDEDAPLWRRPDPFLGLDRELLTFGAMPVAIATISRKESYAAAEDGPETLPPGPLLAPA